MPSICAVNDNTLFFARANTELAYILKRTSEEIYHSGSTKVQTGKYQAALNIDESLLLWKSQISPEFDFNNVSLTEPETVTKRKIVLKLRKLHQPYRYSTTHEMTRILQCPNSHPSSFPCSCRLPRLFIHFCFQHQALPRCFARNHRSAV
jgi:hypothetical protein